MSDLIDSSWFASRLGNRTRSGIARETAALVRSGALPVGSKLPTVRDLAFALGVSPATVSQAWSELRRYRVISGRGRNGSWVIGDAFTPRPERLLGGLRIPPGSLNLARAVPDPALLPDLHAALAHGAAATGLNSYDRERILPELDAVLRPLWPYDPSALLAMDGGYSAVYTVLHALVPPGAPVAVEDPTGLRLLDILEDLNVPILPVPVDRHGPKPEALSEVLKRKPAMFIFQPRLHAVTGCHLAPERLQLLGDCLQASDTLIVENDGIGDISDRPRQSLGGRFPDRVIHTISFSKTLGPDLRLAALSASAVIVEQIQSYRGFSAGWTSRILQGAVAWLLADGNMASKLSHARAVYAERRAALAEALAALGMVTEPGQGLSLLVPMPNSMAASLKLRETGIVVEAGDQFSTGGLPALRIATSCLPPQQAQLVARAVAALA